MNNWLLDREQVELAERMALAHLMEEYIQLLRLERQLYERQLEASRQPPNRLHPLYLVGGVLPGN